VSAGRRPLIALALLVAAAAAAGQWWFSRQQLALGREMAALARPGDIRMLSSTTCAVCTGARVWFKLHEIAFDECFIEKDRDCARRLQATRSPGTPVILVRGQTLVGFEPQRIRAALSAAAEPAQGG